MSLKLVRQIGRIDEVETVLDFLWAWLSGRYLLHVVSTKRNFLGSQYSVHVLSPQDRKVRP